MTTHVRHLYFRLQSTLLAVKRTTAEDDDGVWVVAAAAAADADVDIIDRVSSERRQPLGIVEETAVGLSSWRHADDAAGDNDDEDDNHDDIDEDGDDDVIVRTTKPDDSTILTNARQKR